jgi:hypothetical protein
MHAALLLFNVHSVNVVLLETLLFSALSEQTTFVALLMHRFKVRGASLAFKAAAVQSYVCKGVVFCLCWVVYARVFYNGLAVVPGALSFSCVGLERFLHVLRTHRKHSSGCDSGKLLGIHHATYHKLALSVTLA